MSNSTTVDGGTIVTIPANSLWHGSISLCATLAVSAGGAAATSFPSITLSGEGGTWPDGHTIAALALFVPAVGATAVTGSQATESMVINNVSIRARDNDLSFILNHGAGITAVGTACGEIL
jgi:hypothetical protein